MIDLHTLEGQLKSAGCNFRFWGRAEIEELKHILMDGETIKHGVNGHYSGGFAFLCVTDRRLLLIDRKPMYLTLEDVRFDMIAEVAYSYRLLDATIRVFTPNKSLVFTSWSQYRLRQLMNYTQQRVMEIRQYYLGQQFQSSPTPQPVPGIAPSFSLQPDNGATLAQQQGGQSGVSSSVFPMHNPYAQVSLVSRRWARNKRFRSSQD